MIKETLIAKRLSKEHQFNSFATLGEYANRLNVLNIPFTVTYSKDELTRTRILMYDEVMDNTLKALNEEFSFELNAEQARKESLGIIETLSFEKL